MPVSAETDEGLVQLVCLVGIKGELGPGQLELGIVIGGAGAVLTGVDVCLLGLDPRVERIEPLRDLERLTGEGGCVLSRTTQCAGERLIDLAVGQMQRILCILTLLRHGRL